MTTLDWYDSEEHGAIASELRRIRRRVLRRPFTVVSLTLAASAALILFVVTRPNHFEAQVVLALTEGSMSAQHNEVPADELRAYVATVLLPDAKLASIIEQYDLYPLRRTHGMQFALDGLRSQMEIEIWKNSLIAGDEDEPDTEKSARIGITVVDNDAERAFALAHALAQGVRSSAGEYRQRLDDELVKNIAARRAALEAQMTALDREQSAKQVELAAAKSQGDAHAAAAAALRLVEIPEDRKRTEKRISEIATSRDALADQVFAAGLDMQIAVVEERRPEMPTHPEFTITVLAILLTASALFGVALIVGAFDGKVYDRNDLRRLGVHVLGHVPSFPGDHIGSQRRRQRQSRITRRESRSDANSDA